MGRTSGLWRGDLLAHRWLGRYAAQTSIQKARARSPSLSGVHDGIFFYCVIAVSLILQQGYIKVKRVTI